MFYKFFIFFLIFFSFSAQAEEKSFIYDFIEQESKILEEMQENIQEDLDLLFAEYCYFNTDERCFEDTSKKTKPVPKPEPQDKDEEESEEEQLSWNEIKTELIEVMHEICL